MFAGDSAAALVNEEMVRSMKWVDPIGKRLSEDDRNPETKDRSYTVVGVIRDFHQHSLHSPITPIALLRSSNNFFLNIKISSTNIPGTLEYIRKSWNEVTNGRPFSYHFLDDTFQQQYAADEKRGQIFSLFSLACILISCVGLFGLAAYTTEQRTKEIGIRKVVGASAGAIVRLFYSSFVRLFATGVIIAFPISYVVMDNWMNNYAYQTGMHWSNFWWSAIGTATVAMGSIAFYAFRAAMIDPVASLKSE